MTKAQREMKKFLYTGKNSVPQYLCASASIPLLRVLLLGFLLFGRSILFNHEVVAQAYGVASWYGQEFHGRQTASGEIYNMRRITAAHRTLPFGTYVRVTCLDNKRSIIVRINDRGPFVPGRIIDLSRGSARRLGIIEKGIAPVRLDVYASGQKY